MKLRLFLIGLALCPVLLCADRVDPVGWDKAKWGMTLDEVRAAYGDRASDSTAVPGPNFVYIDRLTIKNVTVSDIEMLASIQTKRNSERISSVELGMVADVTGPRREREYAFVTFKSLLIAKYGTADNEDAERQPRAVVKTLLWSLPSTSITLIWNEGTDYQFGYVTVRYRQIEKNPL
jgi:hypothetical protein